MPKVDDENFFRMTEVWVEKGSGDSKTKLIFTVIHSTEKPRQWLFHDDKAWWLYHLANPSEEILAEQVTVAKKHEVFKANKVSDLGSGFPLNFKQFTWVTLAQPLKGVPEAYRHSREALLVGHGPKAVVLPAIPLLCTEPDCYFSPSYPASELPRRQIEVTQEVAGEGLGPAQGLAAALTVLFGLSVLIDFSWPARLIYIFGPMAALFCIGSWRTRSYGRLARLVSGAFFLHFFSRGIDVAITSEWEDAAGLMYESWKLAVIFGLLGLLAKIQPRLYFGFVDGAYQAGAFFFPLFATVLVFVSSEQEFNYLRFFNYYAGVMPWGAMLGVVGLAAVGHRLWDYRHAPVNKEDFRKLLCRTTEILGQGVAVAPHRSARLAAWADDLEDGLSISLSPEVLSLAKLGPEFLLWRTQAGNLGAYQGMAAEQKSLVEDALGALHSDFQELVEALDNFNQGSPITLRTLRHSPLLATWGQ
jgi:hypothetical protein